MSINREYFSWRSLNCYLDEDECEFLSPSADEMQFNLACLGEKISYKMHNSYQCWLWWLTMLPLLLMVWYRLKITGYCRLPNDVDRLMYGDTNTTFSAIKQSYFYVGLVAVNKGIRPAFRLPYLWARWRFLVKLIVRRIQKT